MANLRDLVTESKYIKREFGEPLPTFNGVMKQHQVNKLKEDWWSSMSANQQAAYKKAHPKSQQAQDAKDKEEPKKDVKGREYDPMTGKGKGKDSRNEPDDEEYFKSMMGGGEPEDKPHGGDTGKDADYGGGDFTKSADYDMWSDDEPEDEGPKEFEKGAKVTAKWTGVSGDEQSIPDGEVEDVKYTERGTEYVIRWNNGNNLIQLPADSVKDEEPEKAGRTGKELGENKMNERVDFHTITGNKRFMTKTALTILRKHGVKNVKVLNVAGDFLEIRFPIDSNKLKKIDKELKRKNKTAYGGIVENRRDKMNEAILRKVIREEIKRMIEEDEEAFSQPIPAQIDRYMKKFIDAVNQKNLNRKRKLAILGRTIVALRLDPTEVSKYARLVKREL